MSRFAPSNAVSAVAAAGILLSFLTATAEADPASIPDNIHVSGVYHSVTNGIPNYDGFDRFRDANGQPLPGWELQLRSPG